MKKNIKIHPQISIVFLALICLFHASCTGDLDITGTYVHHAESEFSIADDTIIVALSQDQDYLISKSTGYRSLDEAGNQGPLVLEKEHRKGRYNPDSGILEGTGKGGTISFDKTEKVLKLGANVYLRIK
ncbi:hypothetical protein [Pedobacter sp. GR22-6]|uniref:hypothetical protein n=1 Tax=Pedobacter sp. GR22-6 TaxID=3127957 RepID=UPI00307D5572